MSCTKHGEHDHQHGEGCGHTAVKHDDHIDYLHDGHLHHVHDDHVDEHHLIDGSSSCTPDHSCGHHEDDHRHGEGCGHMAIPHGDHVDYIVGEHLHHSHNGHCDDHGKVSICH